MQKLLLLWVTIFLTVPALGHGGVSREILKQLFPEAENFVNRRKVLTPQQISKVERDSGDSVQKADINLEVFVAVAKDSETGKMKSLGGALMIDAAVSAGTVDMVIAYNLDGSVKKVIVMDESTDQSLNSDGFLGQFEGKGLMDGWDPETDFSLTNNSVDSRSLIKAVYRGLHLFLAFLS